MATFFNLVRDINGINTFGLEFSDLNYSMILTASTAQSVTVPSDYENWVAVFSYTPGSTVWVDDTTTAAIPSGAASFTTSQLNPAVRQVKAGDVISLITPDATNDQVGVSFYALF